MHRRSFFALLAAVPAAAAVSPPVAVEAGVMRAGAGTFLFPSRAAYLCPPDLGGIDRNVLRELRARVMPAPPPPPDPADFDAYAGLDDGV